MITLDARMSSVFQCSIDVVGGPRFEQIIKVVYEARTLNFLH